MSGTRAAGCAAGLHDQGHDPLHARGEADGRGRLSAQLRNQAVVAAARANRILRAERIGDPLEHGPRIIVQPAHQPRIDLIGNAHGLEGGAQRREVLPRLLVQVIA